MLGVTASVMPAAFRFSCHLLFSARPPSRMACTGNQAAHRHGQHLGTLCSSQFRLGQLCHFRSACASGTGILPYTLLRMGVTSKEQLYLWHHMSNSICIKQIAGSCSRDSPHWIQQWQHRMSSQRGTGLTAWPHSCTAGHNISTHCCIHSANARLSPIAFILDRHTALWT